MIVLSPYIIIVVIYLHFVHEEIKKLVTCSRSSGIEWNPNQGISEDKKPLSVLFLLIHYTVNEILTKKGWLSNWIRNNKRSGADQDDLRDMESRRDILKEKDENESNQDT